MFRFLLRKLEELGARFFQPIPEDFYSVETGSLFRHCIECQDDLSGENATYLIEKVFQQEEVIFEYALCHRCAKNLRQELSKDSLQTMKRALQQSSVRKTVDQCRVCELPRHDLLSYTIVGMCLGSDMLYHDVPILLCEPCLEDIVANFSQQTKDTLDDFQDRNFPGPPGLEEDLPKPKRKVVLV